MDVAKPSISVGDVNNAQGVAVGDGAQVVIQQAPPAPKPGSAPPLPSLVIGREDDLRNLKARLGLTGESSLQVLTAIRGWPGIGKTTIAAVLAHDPEIAAAFPDGVLWRSRCSKYNLSCNPRRIS
jgi:hypothetical protein